MVLALLISLLLPTLSMRALLLANIRSQADGLLIFIIEVNRAAI